MGGEVKEVKEVEEVKEKDLDETGAQEANETGKGTRKKEMPEGEKKEGATAVSRAAPSKSSRKFTGFPGQSGDPTALRLIASSKLIVLPASFAIQPVTHKSREAPASAD